MPHSKPGEDLLTLNHQRSNGCIWQRPNLYKLSLQKLSQPGKEQEWLQQWTQMLIAFLSPFFSSCLLSSYAYYLLSSALSVRGEASYHITCLSKCKRPTYFRSRHEIPREAFWLAHPESSVYPLTSLFGYRYKANRQQYAVAPCGMGNVYRNKGNS